MPRLRGQSIGTTFQCEPSQRSMTGNRLKNRNDPVAQHVVGAGHATPLSAALVRASVACHPAPSHASANAVVPPRPTAMHVSLAGQATDASEFPPGAPVSI